MNNIPKMKPRGQSLIDWCNENGEWGQHLLSEWNDILNSSIGLTPYNIAKGSEQPVYWTCEYGHTWTAVLNNRTNGKTGCPNCSNNGTSYAEQFIYWALKQIYPNTENRCKVLKSKENPQGIEFDIGVPDIPLCIEYSPTHWHNGKEERDNLKKEICQKFNIRFLQIIEDSYKELNSIYTDNLIVIRMNEHKKDCILEELVSYILNSVGHSISEIDLKLVKDNAWTYSHIKIDINKSIKITHPELAKEFHPTLNGNKRPELLSYGSTQNVYWQCIKCGYGSEGEWITTVGNRTKTCTSCPCCNYNFNTMNYKSSTYMDAIPGVNDLQTVQPELAKEYHPTLNDTDVTKIKVGSNRGVYWQCTKCGYGELGEWYVRPASRCNEGQKSGCPNCGYNWFNGTVRDYKIDATLGVNDLATVYPEIAKEWHPTLNKRPIHEVACRSHDKVYWQCTKCGYGKNGEWVATVNRRTAKGWETGCPNCKYFWLIKDYKKNKKSIPDVGLNDIASLHPWLVDDWHPTLNRLKPSEMRPYSRTRVYFQCPNCSYGKNGEWHTLLMGRINRNSGCPQCRYNSYKKHKGMPQNIRLGY